MKLPLNQVLCADAFQVLKEFPKESIDTVLFSPSYWGLRDYSTVASLTSKDREKVKSFQLERFEWFSTHYPQYKYEITEIRFNERTKDYTGSVKAIFGEQALGLEPHPSQYIERMVELCRLLRRVLKKSGSMYVNMGDTYYGSPAGKTAGKGRTGRFKLGDKDQEERIKGSRGVPDKGKLRSNWLQPKQLMLIPSRVAIALQDDGWILRNDIVWHKPNHMPSSVKDRLTNSWEHIFHFVKARKYFYDLDAIRKPHKNLSPSAKRSTYAKRDKECFRHFGEGQDDRIYPNPLGKNPGDTITAYEGKFNGFGVEAEKFGSPRARTQRKSDGYENLPHRRRDYAIVHDWYKDHPLSGKGKNPSDFLSIPTQPFPQAHFAVYPEAICEAPIKASCPAQICVACGKPRKRLVKGKRVDLEGWGPATKQHTEIPISTIRNGKGRMGKYVGETVGFSDCGCQKGFTPGVVLDPMCGAGTTLKVAHKLGRRWIGIDLNPSYVEMTIRGLEKIGAFSARLDKFACGGEDAGHE